MSFNNYAVAVIKPDAIGDGIADQILCDLEDHDLVALFHHRCEIFREQAVILYDDTRESTWYEPGLRSLVGESEVVLLKADNHAIDAALRAKGRSLESGIRLKYANSPSIEEMLASGLTEEEALNEAARNRIHVPDTKEKTIEAMLILFGTYDWKLLETIEPELLTALRDELRDYREPRELSPRL